MASGKYNYFVSFQIFSSTGRPLSLKNGYSIRNRLVATRKDVEELENELKEEFALDGEKLILTSFTQLTGGITN